MMLGNRPMSEWIARYEQSHQHPVNRLCHAFGIPLIAVSILLFLAAILVEGLWPAGARALRAGVDLPVRRSLFRGQAARVRP